MSCWTRIYTFSRKFQPKWNATKIDKIFSGRCSANQIFQFGRCLFFINRNVFRHLKLEIALAIPALNVWKRIWKNSAGQGLTICIWWSGRLNYSYKIEIKQIIYTCSDDDAYALQGIFSNIEIIENHNTNPPPAGQPCCDKQCLYWRWFIIIMTSDEGHRWTTNTASVFFMVKNRWHDNPCEIWPLLWWLIN